MEEPMKGPMLSLLACCCVVFANASNAECQPTACVGFVDQVYVEANGNLYVQTSGNETLANCTPNSGIYLYLAASATNFKEIYAMLLTAETLGWQVTLRIVDSSNPCTISWASVNRQ
jgi:hypothetical protein